MGFTNLKQPHSATRKDQEGRRVALDTWYLQFQHDARLRHLKSQCTWLYPVSPTFCPGHPEASNPGQEPPKERPSSEKMKGDEKRRILRAGWKSDAHFLVLNDLSNLPLPRKTPSKHIISSAIIRYPIIIWYTIPNHPSNGKGKNIERLEWSMISHHFSSISPWFAPAALQALSISVPAGSAPEMKNVYCTRSSESAA